MDYINIDEEVEVLQTLGRLAKKNVDGKDCIENEGYSSVTGHSGNTNSSDGGVRNYLRDRGNVVISNGHSRSLAFPCGTLGNSSLNGMACPSMSSGNDCKVKCKEKAVDACKEKVVHSLPILIDLVSEDDNSPRVKGKGVMNHPILIDLASEDDDSPRGSSLFSKRAWKKNYAFVNQSNSFEEPCAICLETPTTGDIIRHLPCLHKFCKHVGACNLCLLQFISFLREAPPNN